MKTFQTYRLKPNPAGKDRGRFGATPSQLAAEWVDLRNTGAAAVALTGVTLTHVAYKPGASQGHWEPVFTFGQGVLNPGQVVRIHAGQARTGVILPEDLAGADYHLFTGEDRYVWNNDRGDCSSLWEAGQPGPYDSACYPAAPPEGVVLVRSGNALVVPAGSYAAAGRR